MTFNFLDVKLNFYDASEAGKEKLFIRSRNYEQNLWNTAFSLATTWREEENAEGCRKLCDGIMERNSDGAERYLPDNACAKFAEEK